VAVYEVRVEADEIQVRAPADPYGRSGEPAPPAPGMPTPEVVPDAAHSIDALSAPLTESPPIP
jgi:hypothetical protein